jgi:hypothetical protein
MARARHERRRPVKQDQIDTGHRGQQMGQPGAFRDRRDRWPVAAVITTTMAAPVPVGGWRRYLEKVAWSANRH